MILSQPRHWTAATGLLVFFLTASLWADSSGQISVGAQFDGWSANSTAPFNGYEILVPFNLNYQVDKDCSFYGQTAFADGSYTDSVAGTETLNLTALTDSVVGSELHFNSFGVASLADVAVNIPTGDASWEVKEEASNIPTEFLDSRYQGRGLGLSALYGVAFPDGKVEWGTAVGYYYSGALNPDYGAVPAGEKLGDSFFVALNRVESFPGNQSSVFRLSGLYFLTTQVSGVDNFRMGPNLNASYAFHDPQGLSYEIGGQFFFPAARLYGGALSTEPFDSLGQRLYLAPSLVLGDWTFAGMVKYILPNGYSPSDASGLYDGGGFLFGLTPTYTLALGPQSDLELSAGYDFIIHHDAGYDFGGARLDLDYSYGTLGATYVVKL